MNECKTLSDLVKLIVDFLLLFASLCSVLLAFLCQDDNLSFR